LANAQEQQDQSPSNSTIDGFTLNIDVLGVNSGTRNSTISITGSDDESSNP
jgi:hypothetical protein